MAVLAPVAQAQIVVDPAGSGAFTDLQAAIDAAPPGSVLRVLGGTYGPLRIDKSLTIVGDPAPLISSPRMGSGVQVPGIDLVGTGTESFRAAHIQVSGTAAFPYNGPGPGIRSAGFAEIGIYHSIIRGHEYEVVTATGTYQGQPGLLVRASDTPRITISDSTVQGSASGVDASLILGPPGPAGVDAPGATVLAVDSRVTGGDGSDSVTFGSGTPCPCPGGFGVGGPGVIAATLYLADLIPDGGRGGQVMLTTGSSFMPWGQQPDGPGLQVGDLQPAGAFSVVAPDPIRQGANWSLYFTPRGGLAAALLAAPLGAPQTQPGFRGPLFLDLSGPKLLIGFPASKTGLTFPVPIDPLLGGAEIAFQIAIIGSRFNDLSKPIPGMVGF
ncbi:MAG: hypothetical protein AAF628_19145 [Planctomycetota bacterium]